MIKEKFSNIFEKITNVYIAVIILIFPLIVDSTGFFNIQECKYRAFVCISGIYLILEILMMAFFILVKREKILKKPKFSKIQIFALIFLAINVLSCILSPFKNEDSFWVGIGRGEGVITIALYVLTFLFITFFGKFEKRHILYFSISSILVNFIAILQFIGFNPFNMYRDGIGTYNVSFMTTIGNVDFISALYTILLTISFAAYTFMDNNKYENIIHLLSLAMGSFIFNIIDVNSGKVSFLCMMALALPFILTSSKRLRKLVNCVNCVLIANCINYILNTEYHYDVDKIIFNFQFNYIVVLFLGIIATLFILSRILKNVDYDLTNNTNIIKAIFGVYIVGAILLVVTIYFVNIDYSFLTEIHNMLHGNFSDEYGTYRVFLWKRAFKLIKEYPLLGSGSDTFAIRFMSKYSEDVASIGEYSINDTAANVYLTMAINIGIIGVISYLIFVFLQMFKGIKYRDNPVVFTLLLAVFCYAVQDFFNLWVVIVTPIYWCLLGIYFNSLKNAKNVENLK